MRGKLIIFEGIDGSGKETQSIKIASLINKNTDNIKITHLHFPDYNTCTGKLIKKILHKEVEYPTEAFQLLYAANRLEKKELIEKFLSKGINIICDRYTYSSVAFGMAEGQDRSFLHSIDSRMPKPDKIVLFDLYASDAYNRMKNKDKDKNESDIEFLGKVRRNYLELYYEQTNFAAFYGISSKWEIIEASETESKITEILLVMIMQLINS